MYNNKNNYRNTKQSNGISSFRNRNRYSFDTFPNEINKNNINKNNKSKYNKNKNNKSKTNKNQYNWHNNNIKPVIQKKRIIKYEPIVNNSDRFRTDSVDRFANTPENIITGANILLQHKYILWCHDLRSKDWSIKSYKNLCTIESISDFWRVLNNFHKLGTKYMHFFLMKNNIHPTWEDKLNRYGGICSFKIELDKSLDIWEDLCVRFMCNKICKNSEDLNGISFSPKNIWCIIKIWNKDSKNNLTQLFYPEILKKYNNISIKYKSNIPEYK